MPNDDLLNAIETSILESIPKPDKETEYGLDDIGENIKKMFPLGPADTTAFIDFSIHALATENLYAIPVAGNDFAGDRNSVGEVVTEAYNLQIEKWKQSVATKGYNEKIIETIATKAAALKPLSRAKFLSRVFTDLPEVAVDDENAVDTEKLRKLAEKLDGLIDIQGYNFDIFQPDTINLGLRLIYRQEWKPLQYQTGELLNTIPLTPGEKIKYETKVWQTTKSTQEINESTTYSTEEILSTTERDVHEIMKRAAQRFTISTEASGSGNLGIWKASGSVKSTYDYQQESKETKNRFREAMSKSTQSIKNERKVSINISTEIGSESKMTREISNPNDEITVTYLFYELQRAYEVTEYLYDFVPVVYVANPIPTANEITDDWVIRHDWIIAGAIRDKSFIENLVFISQEMPGLKFARNTALEVYQEALSVLREIKKQLQVQRENLTAAIEKLKNGGLTLYEIFDILKSIREARTEIAELQKRLEPAQTALDKAEERFSEENFKYEQGRKKVDRLLNHVRDNILHYMQAIWDAEPLGQRYLRLRSILYPHVELTGVELDNEHNPRNPQFEIKEWYPLADVVDTNCPLGYVGNYTVYRLMRDDNAMVNWMAQSFLKTNANGEKQVQDPDTEVRPTIKVSTPTDAVYIEALPGTVPLLEYFKLMHRSIDMEKARQESIKKQLENIRRLELIREGDYGDPEFEKTIISDTNGLLLEHVAGLHDKNDAPNGK
ncbi:MAG: hypothetical protein ILNGONEN_02001 [Syntrophorhabdaceae bacterium]|nr:hypothetical protein [Syntrophorhabdaceae bacterium]